MTVDVALDEVVHIAGSQRRVKAIAVVGKCHAPEIEIDTVEGLAVPRRTSKLSRFARARPVAS